MRPIPDPPVPVPVPVRDDPVLELARAIRRDVAHELRGPVQSVVVNMELARRRLAGGNTEGAAERFDVIEVEVRRLHAVADAFLSLVRELPETSTVFDVDSVLDPMDPLVRVLARAARVRYTPEVGASLPLVRARPEALALAFIRTVVTLNGACGPNGELQVRTRTTPVALELELTAIAGAGGWTADSESIVERAVLDSNQWLQPDGGTVECVPGSDSVALRSIRIRLPRADMA